MPTNSQEISRINHAKSNILFFESFYSKFQHNDWAITVAFYTAIHVVEAVIAHLGEVKYGGKKYSVTSTEDFQRAAREDLPERPCKSKHKCRSVIITENFRNDPINIVNSYEILQANAHTSRYNNYAFQTGVTKRYVECHLHGILTWSNQKIGTDYSVDFSKPYSQ